MTAIDSIRILVSVGTQFPFDRLIGMVDNWAAQRSDMQAQILMQVGPGGKHPAHCASKEFLSPAEYKAASSSAEVLVAHAGIGSILTAVELGLPVIIVPRDFKRGEHRNDHQSSTAREFSTRKGVYVATDEATLHDLLDRRRSLDVPERGEIDAAFASRVDAFIQGGL